MKKIKSIFCVLLLSTVLVGNVFAGDFTGVGFSVFSAAFTMLSFHWRAAVRPAKRGSVKTVSRKKKVEMVIADRLKIKVVKSVIKQNNKPIFTNRLLFCLAFILQIHVNGRNQKKLNKLNRNLITETI